jgi:hypothetical protein
VSQADVEELLRCAGDRDPLVKILEGLRDRDLLGAMMHRLEAYKTRIDVSKAETFVTCFFGIGDSLPTGSNPIFSGQLTPEMNASRIVYWYLKQEPDAQKREQVLERAIAGNDGLLLPIRILALEKDASDPGNRLIGDAALARLQGLVAGKVAKAAQNGTLLANPRLVGILGFWQEVGGGQEVSAWLRNVILTDDGLVALLRGFTTVALSTGGGAYVANRHEYIDVEALEAFGLLAEVTTAVQERPEDRLSSEGRRLRRLFSSTMKARDSEKRGWPLHLSMTEDEGEAP